MNYEQAGFHKNWDEINSLHDRLENEEAQNLRQMLSTSYARQIDMKNKSKNIEDENKRINDSKIIEQNQRFMEIERKMKDNKRKEYTIDRIQDIKQKLQKVFFLS